GDTPRSPELLTQLAYGVEDWVSEAAQFGLAVAAWVDPACRAEVARTDPDRYVAAARATAQHVVTIMSSLAELVLIVPGIEERVRNHARRVLSNEDDADPNRSADR